MRYLAYGVVVESDVALGVPPDPRPADILVARMESPVRTRSVAWLDRDSDPDLSVGLVPGGFYLRFHKEAEFVVSADGRSLHWFAVAGLSDTLVHLLLDQVLPRALTRLGRVILHGSCVARDDHGCLAICGVSGAGKSTIAAALMARGFRVVADDCVVVQEPGIPPLVVPAYPGLRLSATSIRVSGLTGLEVHGPVSRHSTKMRIAPPSDSGLRVSETRVPLRAIVVLPDPDAEDGSQPIPGVELTPAAAGIELLRHSFQLNGPGERSASLSRILSIADACRVSLMRYDHTDAGLQAVCDAIDAALIDRLPAGRMSG